MKTTQVIKNAVNLLADTVKQTLGTKGRTILFNDENNHTHITKDGVTVAKHIFSEDPYENMIITVLRESSLKTMRSSGDGTTTTMILSQYIINEGLKLLDEGLSYYEMSKQIDNAVHDVVDYIKSKSISIESNTELLRDIASISSNDEELGKYIYDIVEAIGLYGDIQVKKSQYSEVRKVQTVGMKLHKGWMENFMINNTRDLTFTGNDCHILIFDDIIQSIADIDEYIKYLAGKPILILCDDITDITLGQIEKWMRGTGYPACFVTNDGYGERKKIIMNDLAALTSSYIINGSTPFDVDNLGFAGQVHVSETYTSIIDGERDDELVEDIIEDIKETLADDELDDEMNLTGVDRKFYKKRLANLTGGMAIIHVGAKTEMAMKELKDRLDDAVLAVGSAIKQGVNIGGGSTYINCQKDLMNSYKESKGRGYKLIIDSLDSPFRQLLINAELSNEFTNYKYQLTKGKALDLRDGKLYAIKKMDYTVYDPSSVLIDSIINASTVAKSLLSLKNIIYDGKKFEE